MLTHARRAAQCDVRAAVTFKKRQAKWRVRTCVHGIGDAGGGGARSCFAVTKLLKTVLVYEMPYNSLTVGCITWCWCWLGELPLPERAHLRAVSGTMGCVHRLHSEHCRECTLSHNGMCAQFASRALPRVRYATRCAGFGSPVLRVCCRRTNVVMRTM